MDIKTVGVVGIGLMGSGIAEVVSRKGYNVIAREVSDEFLQKGLSRIQASTTRAVERNKMSPEERESTLGRIKGTVKLDELAACDFVIEAVVENLNLKKDVFERLDQITRPDVIIAS